MLFSRFFPASTYSSAWPMSAISAMATTSWRMPRTWRIDGLRLALARIIPAARLRRKYNRRVETLDRIVRIVIRPQKEWEVVARESTPVDALLRRYILPLSLLAPISTSVGMRVFDSAWDNDSGFRVPMQDMFAAAATTLFGSIAS